MDINTKRKYKKISKNLYKAATSCIVLFFIVLIVLGTKKIDASNLNAAWGMVIIMSPIFIGLFFAFFGAIYYEYFNSYHKKVIEYRKRFHITKIYEFIDIGDFEKAIPIYNNLKQSMDKDMLYIYLIKSSMDSDDPKQKAKGLENYNVIRNWYDVEKVFN